MDGSIEKDKSFIECILFSPKQKCFFSEKKPKSLMEYMHLSVLIYMSLLFPFNL